MNKYILIFILFFFFKRDYSQNLISNSSFDKVKISDDTSRMHYMGYKGKSDVLDWYVPQYLNHPVVRTISNVHYYSAWDNYLRDREGKHSYYDLQYGRNYGFVELEVQNLYSGIIQQHLKVPLKKGKYCLKIKYKRCAHSIKTVERDINFCFSKTDLKKYQKENFLQIPDSLIQFSFNDTTSFSYNIPWQEVSSVVELKGDEEFLTIGALTYEKYKKKGINTFFLDDIELTAIKENMQCTSTPVNKNLVDIYSVNFPIGQEINSDSLTVYNGIDRLGDEADPIWIYTPGKMYMLNSIIAFMQKDPNIKIQFTEYHVNMSTLPFCYQAYSGYMNFYNITKDRISADLKMCMEGEKYCDLLSPYYRVSFMFYK